MKHYSVSLSCESIKDYVSDEFSQANSVNVTLGDLSTIPFKILENVIKLLPEHLATLDLSKCKLNQLPIDDLMKLMMLLPKGLKSLDLGDNDLDQVDPTNLLKLVASLPQRLETVDFKGCSFKRCSAKELENIILALRDNIKSFELHLIDLNRFSLSELQTLFKALPKTQRSLDLRGFNWDRFSSNEFLQLLNSIPASVTAVKFNRINLPFKGSDEALLNLLQKAKLNIQNIAIDYREIQPNELRKLTIYRELERLNETKLDKNNCWVTMGIIESSDAKIDSLEHLVKALDSSSDGALTEWKAKHGEVINKQRNRLHAFFYPHHISQTQKVVDEAIGPLFS